MLPGCVDKVALLAAAVALLTPEQLLAGKENFFSQGTHLRLIRSFDRIGLDLDLWPQFLVLTALLPLLQRCGSLSSALSQGSESEHAGLDL